MADLGVLTTISGLQSKGTADARNFRTYVPLLRTSFVSSGAVSMMAPIEYTGPVKPVSGN